MPSSGGYASCPLPHLLLASVEDGRGAGTVDTRDPITGNLVPKPQLESWVCVGRTGRKGPKPRSTSSSGDCQLSPPTLHSALFPSANSLYLVILAPSLRECPQWWRQCGAAVRAHTRRKRCTQINPTRETLVSSPMTPQICGEGHDRQAGHRSQVTQECPGQSLR